MKLQRISKAVIFLAVLIVLIWDGFAQIYGGLESTVSWAVWDAVGHYPIISLLAGFVSGHLFWTDIFSPKPAKTLEPIKKASRIIIIVAVAIVIVWDLYAWFGKGGGPGNTVSYVVWTFSGKAPFIPFLSGLILGRLFWGDPRMPEKDKGKSDS